MSVANQIYRQLTLGDSFDKKFGRRENLSKSLAQATDIIKSDLTSKKSNADTEKIQNALNELFYPKDETNPVIARERIQEEILQENLQNMQERVNSIFNAINTNYNGTAESLINASDFNKKYLKKDSGTNGFTLSYIDKLKNNIQEKINNLNQAIYDQNKNTILNAIQEIENQKIQLKTLLNQYGAFVNNLGVYSFSQFNVQQKTSVISILKTIYLLYEAVNNSLSVEDWDVFERSLAEAAKYFVDANVEELGQLFKTSLTGREVVQRGVSPLPFRYQVTTNAISQAFNQKRGFSYNTEKATITFSPASSKQGKMDVQLHWNGIYNGNDTDYRTSAKKWRSKKNGFGLGSTSIFGALARSAGQSAAEAYVLATLRTEDQFYKTWGEGLPPAIGIKEAHKLAKLSLLSDVAMGLNQRSGYANLLVIDTGSKIEVYNIAEKIEDYLKGQNEIFKFVTYREGAVEKVMADIYNQQIRRIGRTQTMLRTNTYFALAFSRLNTMRVTVSPKF